MKLITCSLLVVLFCSGCSTVNESFSCNKTAGDSCLTMDEVNAMTEEKGAYVRKQVLRPQRYVQDEHNVTEGLWIAGQEQQGASHG